jgi:hypothetical protein
MPSRYLTDIEKNLSRVHTISGVVHELWPGGHPQDRDYLCLPGEVNEDGRIARHSEISYVCGECGLVPYDRVWAFEHRKNIYKANCQVEEPVHWVRQGDMIVRVGELVACRAINPWFVNADLMVTPPKACLYAAELMSALSSFGDVVLTVNVILKHRSFDFSRSFAESLMSALMKDGWARRSDLDYVYTSEGKGCAEMLTMVCYRASK